MPGFYCGGAALQLPILKDFIQSGLSIRVHFSGVCGHQVLSTHQFADQRGFRCFLIRL